MQHLNNFMNQSFLDLRRRQDHQQNFEFLQKNLNFINNSKFDPNFKQIFNLLKLKIKINE